MSSKQRMASLGVFVLAAFLAMPVMVNAEEMLQNTGFETYDASTLVPDNWTVIEGSAEAYTGDVNEGSASVYSLGGNAVYDESNGEWVVTANTTQGGTLSQLVDLSTLTEYATYNWIDISMSAYVHLWSGTRITMYLEYLPASYDSTTVTVDDAVWNGNDVVTAASTGYTSTRTVWSKRTATAAIPKVKWARVRLVFDATWHEDNDFTGGDYYVAVDTVSLDAEMIVPDTPCADNLLLNPGFESISGAEPADWYVASGVVNAIDSVVMPPYADSWYAGNVGGIATSGGDNPNETQYGVLVQLVDMSTLTDFADASFLLFSFSGKYISKGIVGDLTATLEYLPASYNDTLVTWDDAVWEGDDVQRALVMPLSNTSGTWNSFATEQGSIPAARWVRVRLNIDDSRASSGYTGGLYLGGFDQLCLQAEAFVAEKLPANSSFEISSNGTSADDWHQDSGSGAPTLMHPGYDGASYLGKQAAAGDTMARVYQVIDLADKIPGWVGIDQANGEETIFRFIRFTLGAQVINYGGTAVRIGLEYLPYSYNDIDAVTWDDPAWQPRDWTSDGENFTNNGGDAIDAGSLIEDVTADSTWHETGYDGWLPRVRWIRLYIELDATSTGATPQVGIDAVEFAAQCFQWGPYSGFGNLPEATFYENPDAPDKGIPAWVGPEGDGISGGYTGQTEQNYVNPVFAGFADNYVNYIPSGENIYNELFMEPMAITGSPWNDAEWNYVIVTLGDLGLANLADYFGPTPSGTFQPGEITATFDECPIVNGPGPDFVTFENGFSSRWTTPEIFAELAYVEVSSNGVDFIRFPTHSLTPRWPGAYGTIYATGVFGLTGKHINAYGDQWGTPFDLDWLADHPLVLNGTVDLDNIRYVKQVDVVGGGPEDGSGTGNFSKTGFFHDSYGNIIFDSWPTWGSGGADLDAVAVMNTSATDSDGDNIVDYWDNCPATVNEKQYDTDGDGYGNACDCDIDGEEGGDGVVSYADYLLFKAAYGGNGPIMIPGAPGEPNTYEDASENWNPDADFNGDLNVNYADYLLFKSRYGTSTPFE
ncbi:MAG: hypothetical protein CSA20_01980 [Deltaproteobacteria bacterium]|nr:MAG: hypothetical protein CSA20_01980 [Deltaproteobacteria bacterium]